MKPDLVWLRKLSVYQWLKVVLVVKVTLAEDKNKAIKENDEKQWGWFYSRNCPFENQMDRIIEK